MKIILKNIGVFKETKYELGDLTIICGENNTGKTYATYSLYGFFDFWEKGFTIPFDKKYLDEIINNGMATIPLPTNISNANEIVKQASSSYVDFLPSILAANKKYFEDSNFLIELEEKDLVSLETYQKSLGTANREIINISKDKGENSISVNLLLNKDQAVNSSARRNIKSAIANAMKEIVFGRTFTNVFIASAERTGAAIFKSELNLPMNALIKGVASDSDPDPMDLISKIYSSGYALPVRRNVDFIRKIEDLSKNDSFVSREHSEILNDFADIIGGEYKVGREGLHFIPDENKRVKLTLGESSSAVRSLLDVGFYLRYAAEKGDLLIIDEPELNLHPCNQRKLARLLSRLVGIGIKIFITTHSDYIVKELNSLIMLNFKKQDENIKHLMTKFKYKESELISPEKIKVFISEKTSPRKPKVLRQAKIDSFYGIGAESFDNSIIEMNKIQESIILGRS